MQNSNSIKNGIAPVWAFFLIWGEACGVRRMLLQRIRKRNRAESKKSRHLLEISSSITTECLAPIFVDAVREKQDAQQIRNAPARPVATQGFALLHTNQTSLISWINLCFLAAMMDGVARMHSEREGAGWWSKYGCDRQCDVVVTRSRGLPSLGVYSTSV